MAVGNNHFPEMKKIPGIKLGTVCAGIKQTERDDTLIIEMAEGSTCAAVFTKNAFCAAPVIVAKDHLENQPRWLLVNSGNANAGTGDQGLAVAKSTCLELARLVNANAGLVMPFSTGVIGEPLPAQKLISALPKAIAELSENHWEEAARAIMTTDTFAKGATRTVEIEGHAVSISGISKGAGMIQPNMATMLAFIGTDARISHELLQQFLQRAVAETFNRITVDGDTSTNDACVLMASAQSPAPKIQQDSICSVEFYKALLEVCQDLSTAIVRDGEGATKLIRITIEEARDSAEALLIGKTIAHSPLVKTAFFASDPNWGRILAAVGRAEVDALNVNDVVIHLNHVCVVKNGGRADGYTEEDGQAVMEKNEIEITVVLGRGEATEQVLTCDMSYDYVRINAEYRT